MLLQLDRLLIQLKYDDRRIQEQLLILLDKWPNPVDVANSSIVRQDSRNKVDVIIEAAVKLSPKPEEGQAFQGKIYHTPGEESDVTIYRQQDEITFFFISGAIARLAMAEEKNGGLASVFITIQPAALNSLGLENILFTCLAPLLRRQGCFLVHAFAVTRGGRALLLTGPSGSGKTTAGLALTSSGWGFLSNDVVMLIRRSDGVYALPTPGGIGLSTQTISLVPGLDRKLGSDYHPTGQKTYWPASPLTGGWSGAARVGALCFPRVRAEDECKLSPRYTALTLAELMEASIDRWDEVCLVDHIDLLQILSDQANGYSLDLGADVAQLSELLEAIW